jgi:hypothetical protein
MTQTVQQHTEYDTTQSAKLGATPAGTNNAKERLIRSHECVLCGCNILHGAGCSSNQGTTTLLSTHVYTCYLPPCSIRGSACWSQYGMATLLGMPLRHSHKYHSNMVASFECVDALRAQSCSAALQADLEMGSTQPVTAPHATGCKHCRFHWRTNPLAHTTTANSPAKQANRQYKHGSHLAVASHSAQTGGSDRARHTP